MKLARCMTLTLALAMIMLFAVGLPLAAQQLASGPTTQPGVKTNPGASPGPPAPAATRTRLARPRSSRNQPVTEPAKASNPEYLSGEAIILVAAASSPEVRIGMAQNGVTLIELPATDRLFALHAGNADLVAIEKSPSLNRDHHVILRTGKDFVAPALNERAPHAALALTSIIIQMDTGMAITILVYPVALLKQQAHRVVLSYKPEDVISARHQAGLATHLSAANANSQTESGAPQLVAKLSLPVTEPAKVEPKPRPKPDYKGLAETALSEALKNPRAFEKFAKERHSLMISTLPARELSDNVRLVLFAVRNSGKEPLRLVSGYPDLFIETVSEKGRPVEAGARVERLGLASSAKDNSIPAGGTRYFALAYQAPILGARQHLKIVVAHMSAADEPAMADLTALAR